MNLTNLFFLRCLNKFSRMCHIPCDREHIFYMGCLTNARLKLLKHDLIKVWPTNDPTIMLHHISTLNSKFGAQSNHHLNEYINSKRLNRLDLS